MFIKTKFDFQKDVHFDQFLEPHCSIHKRKKCLHYMYILKKQIDNQYLSYLVINKNVSRSVRNTTCFKQQIRVISLHAFMNVYIVDQTKLPVKEKKLILKHLHHTLNILFFFKSN